MGRERLEEFLGYFLLGLGIWSWIIFLILFSIYYEPENIDRVRGTVVTIVYETPYIIKTSIYPSMPAYQPYITLFELKNR